MSTEDQLTAPLLGVRVEVVSGPTYPDLVELIPGVGLLCISGQAVVTPTSNGFAGTLDGTFAIYDNLSVHTTTGQGQATHSCQSSAHRFTLAK